MHPPSKTAAIGSTEETAEKDVMAGPCHHMEIGKDTPYVTTENLRSGSSNRH